MMKFLLLPFILCTSHVLAQDSISLQRWDFARLYPLSVKPSGHELAYVFSVNDGSIRPIGVLGEELETYLSQVPVSHRLYLDYRKKTKRANTWRRISGIGSAVGLLVFGFGIGSEPDHSELVIAGGTLMIGGLLGDVFSKRTGRNARVLLEDSVRMYNRER